MNVKKCSECCRALDFKVGIISMKNVVFSEEIDVRIAKTVYAIEVCYFSNTDEDVGGGAERE